MSFYESHNLEDSDLPFIYNEALIPPNCPEFGASNWHENIEILYIVDGSGTVSNNGEALQVKRGDIVAINSNHLHSLSTDSGMLHRFLIIDSSFCLVNGIDISSVFFDAEIRNSKIRELMEELHMLYFDKKFPYRIASIRSIILRILVLLCTEHSTAKKALEQPERTLSYVKAAIDYIRASYEKNFSLEDVANYVGVNKCYLSREFHRYTGYSFVSYVNRTRCKIAQQLLKKEGVQISHVARKCGFENRSYFARCFQKYTGIIPSEYRKSMLK